jgi:hypothetical protein
VNGEEGALHGDIIALIFSPDSQQLAYIAKDGYRHFVVLDGKEGHYYDDIKSDSLIFSPDGQRLAYIAQVGNKQFVVVDGIEGKQYDAIITGVGGTIIFDYADSFHYLALEGNSVYLVEERLE